MNATSARETRTERRRRVTATKRRRISARHSKAVTHFPHPRIGWYAGLGVMVIFEVIEWPLAIVMMVGHEIAHRAHTKALRDFAEGVEAGA